MVRPTVKMAIWDAFVITTPPPLMLPRLFACPCGTVGAANHVHRAHQEPPLQLLEPQLHALRARAGARVRERCAQLYDPRGGGCGSRSGRWCRHWNGAVNVVCVVPGNFLDGKNLLLSAALCLLVVYHTTPIFHGEERAGGRGRGVKWNGGRGGRGG